MTSAASLQRQLSGSESWIDCCFKWKLKLPLLNIYMGHLKKIIAAILFLSCSGLCFSQADTSKPVKVAVFIPLYTDDVFSGSEYSLGKANLPKNILPGLEFYN